MADIYDYIKELTRFDLEFFDENKNYNSLKSYIKSLDEDKILIEPPSYKKKVYNLPVGQKVYMVICTQEGVFSGESRVVGRELSDISGIWISYPYNSQNVQRREYLRVPLNLNVDITISEDNSGSKKRTLNVITRDISGKGFSFITDEPLNNYFDIESKVYIDNEEPISAKCEHIYTEKFLTKDKSIKYINALAYIDLSQKNIEKIVKRSFKYQLEQRKKGLL